MQHPIKHHSLILSAALLIMLSGSVPGLCVPLEFAPSLGMSRATGDQADEWQRGFTFGLTGFTNRSEPVEYGFSLAFQYARPDAEQMLKIGDPDIQVERKEGSRSITSLVVLARYEVPQLRSSAVRVSFDGGFGLYCINADDIRLKGFSRFFDTAVNHEIHRDGYTECAPGVTLGVNCIIAGHVQPGLAYQHIFSSEEGNTGLFMATLGLLARW